MMVSLSPMVSPSDDIRELAARRRRSVEDVLMAEGNLAEPQDGEDFQALAIIVGDTEQRGIRVKAQHRPSAG